MTIDEVIRGRRTLKGFTPELIDPAIIDELLDLAVYAPNHHTTEPWRFVVVGPVTIARLVAATDDGKLTRSPTAIVVTQAVDADADTAREDYAACACAIQTLMLLPGHVRSRRTGARRSRCSSRSPARSSAWASRSW